MVEYALQAYQMNQIKKTDPHSKISFFTIILIIRLNSHHWF